MQKIFFSCFIYPNSVVFFLKKCYYQPETSRGEKMVDNRGVSPIPSFNFKSGDASGMANKMSDEKMGQGGEYFASEMQEEEENNFAQNNFQDRSAQLRASLDSLAMANAGSMMVMKLLKEKEEKEKLKNDSKQEKNKENKEEKQEQETSKQN